MSHTVYLSLPLPSLRRTVWAFIRFRTNTPAADFCRPVGTGCPLPSRDSTTNGRSPEVSSTTFSAQPPNLQPTALMVMDFAAICQLVRSRLPRIRFLYIGSRLCSTLLSDASSRSRPCASLTFTSIRLVGDLHPSRRRTCSAHKQNRRSGVSEHAVSPLPLGHVFFWQAPLSSGSSALLREPGGRHSCATHLSPRNGFRSATLCDRFETVCNIRARSRRLATVCDTLQPASSRKGSKDVVVEHKGLSDGPVFFRSQRERGQCLPPGDRLPGVSDKWVTPIWAKNIVQERRSEPLYVGVLRRLEKVKGKLRMHRV